jgi:hypothetical protein
VFADMRRAAAGCIDEPPPRRQRRLRHDGEEHGLELVGAPALLEVPRLVLDGADPRLHPSEMLQWLLTRYATGRLNAKDVCTAAWSLRVSEPGLQPLALSPDAQTGKYEPHLSTSLGQNQFVADTLLWQKIPQQAAGRELVKHPFLPPHEGIAADMIPGNAPWVRLPFYQQSELLQQHGPDSCVLAHAFIDGVDIAGKARRRPASILVIYWCPVQDVKDIKCRRLFTAIHKSSLCRCGCRGACTVDAMLAILAWSFEAGKAGVYPTIGPDGMPLTGPRALLGGRPIPVPTELVQFVADGEAFYDVFGFRRWSCADTPCPRCTCTLQSMHDYTSGAWALRDQAGYNAAVHATRHEVHVDEPTAVRLQAALAPNFEKRGRASSRTVDGALHAGDRLVSGGCIRDAYADVSALQYPAQLVFFRQATPATFLHSWSPLLASGLLRFDGLLGDMMHTVDGGVAQYVSGEIFKAVLTRATTLLGDAPGGKMQERLDRAACCLEADYDTWRKGAGAPQLKGLNRHMFVGTAADCLYEWYNIVLSNGEVIPTAQCRRALNLVLNHNACMKALGPPPNGKLAPKHHWWFHLTRAMPHSGNPRFHSCYADESMNAIIAGTARSVHRGTLAVSLFKKYRIWCATMGRAA